MASVSSSRERGAIRRRAETHLGVNGQRGQPFARLGRATHEAADFTDHPCAQCDEIARRESVDLTIRIDRDWAERIWRHHVGGGARHEQAFGQSAPLSLFGQSHQAVRLERIEVVGDLLSRQADPRGQRCRRGGCGQFREESAANGLHGHRRRRRIINDVDIEHAVRVALTIFLVKGFQRALETRRGVPRRPFAHLLPQTPRVRAAVRGSPFASAALSLRGLHASARPSWPISISSHSSLPTTTRAIAFFVNILEFELTEDVPSLTNDGRPKRWVVVRPVGGTTGLLLARADGDVQAGVIGRQFAGRVGLFLRVDDFDATYARLVAAGVVFVTAPRTESYGQVAVFVDVAGNRWDLLSRSPGG
jgi:catechol 2,3-dioxygenase-like lactoylglutathione lyase family enzyme